MKKDKYILYVTGFSPMSIDVCWDKVEKYNKETDTYYVIKDEINDEKETKIFGDHVLFESDDLFKVTNWCNVLHSFRLCIGNLYAELNELKRMRICKK